MSDTALSSTATYRYEARRQLLWDVHAARTLAQTDADTATGDADAIYAALDANLRTLVTLADPPVTPPAAALSQSQLDTLYDWCCEVV